MAGSTFGKQFTVTTFGESHGAGIGCIIDGCPAGITITKEIIQKALDKRRPGAPSPDGSANSAVTKRVEPDSVEILSGVFNDKSEGTPIALFIRNTSQHSSDYNNLKDVFRPGHADFTFDAKYKGFRDYRGGGRSSGRETAARVAAGAVANQILIQKGIKITAYTTKAAGIEISKKDFSQIEQNSMRAPDNDAAKLMQEKIKELQVAGNSAGGIIECVIQNCPIGVGEPVFDKLDAELAKAMLSIGAIKGFEIGDGFAVADSFGSENNDKMHTSNGKIYFETNHAGGVLGGISNGNDIIFRVAVKPVPSIFQSQKTVKKVKVCEDLSEDIQIDKTTYENIDLEIQGRHDVCLCPRIVSVVEAMSAITLADLILRKGE